MAETGGVIAPERAISLQAEVDVLGPADEDAVAALDSDLIEVLQAVWLTLEFCRTGDVTFACDVPVKVLDAWSNHLPGEQCNRLESLFAVPELRRERELQEKWVAEHR